MAYLYWVGYAIFVACAVALELSEEASRRGEGEKYDPTTPIILAVVAGTILWPILLPITIYKQLYPERDKNQ